MITWSSVEQAIHSWLVPAYVPSAIFANQRLPQPAFPYASVLLVASSREGGRDQISTSTDLTRAKSIRVTPTPHDHTTYTITIGTTGFSYISGTSATAAQITAGLAAAMATSGLTVADNAGTLDLSSTAVFHIGVTSNLAWVNRDAGHEVQMDAYGSRRLLYSVSFHVDEANMMPGGAYVLAERARSSLSLESVVESFFASGIAIVKDTGIRDISMVINGRWVSRCVLDVVLRTLVTSEEDIGYVAHATATGNVSGEVVIFDGP